MSDAVAMALHDRYAAALCISDLGPHPFEDCDAKAQWRRDALGMPLDDDRLAKAMQRFQNETWAVENSHRYHCGGSEAGRLASYYGDTE